MIFVPMAIFFWRIFSSRVRNFAERRRTRLKNSRTGNGTSVGGIQSSNVCFLIECRHVSENAEDVQMSPVTKKGSNVFWRTWCRPHCCVAVSPEVVINTAETDSDGWRVSFIAPSLSVCWWILCRCGYVRQFASWSTEAIRRSADPLSCARQSSAGQCRDVVFKDALANVLNFACGSPCC